MTRRDVSEFARVMELMGSPFDVQALTARGLIDESTPIGSLIDSSVNSSTEPKQKDEDRATSPGGAGSGRK